MKNPYIEYITALLLFGTNGIVASKIKLPSYQIVFWCTMIGSLLLIVLFFVTRQGITFTKNKRDICGYLEPLSAVLFALLLLKETLLPLQIIGAILIIAGAMTSEVL